jgi:16S rRNA G966 N2-methylase RsmD
VRRKALGQFFTGLQLSRLLAAVAIDKPVSTILDPMAGHGDLLDAAIERAVRKQASIARVHAVEVDSSTASMCSVRLTPWNRQEVSELRVTSADAFSQQSADSYIPTGYDLVITNPPYVRYQTLSTKQNGILRLTQKEVRENLAAIVAQLVPRNEWPVWREIVDEYSGLADLSVPAWILSAALVKEDGVLALVAPATWRSRNYGKTISRLLSAFFTLDYLIEDTQPGWFSDALVRTQLVVARRRIAKPQEMGFVDDSFVTRVKVSPTASSTNSLVGASFGNNDPEGKFAAWLKGAQLSSEATGIEVEKLLASEILGDVGGGKCISSACNDGRVRGPLFDGETTHGDPLVPQPVLALLSDINKVNLGTLDELGVSVGQGLRTGCNGFFYVEKLQDSGKSARVRFGAPFNVEITVPSECLLPVVRRQSDVSGPVRIKHLKGCVLDLSHWVLPEDMDLVEASRDLYRREKTDIPEVMPSELADFVRGAGSRIYENAGGTQRVSELSAVKTNVRESQGARTPRFWYMLPQFAKRHRPEVFIPRINQDVPWVELNCNPPALIDANFTTVWSASGRCPGIALKALLNSSWCRACMEALGTPLGGGALKLEATQLKRIPIPRITSSELELLKHEGRTMAAEAASVSGEIDRSVASWITGRKATDPKVKILVEQLSKLATSLSTERQRKK